jgi:WD40 repeat protein
MIPPESPRPAADLPAPPSWIASVKPVVPDHELLVRIGGGSYGDVWLGRSVVGTWRAVKVVFRDRFLDSRPYEREFSGIQKFEPLSRSNEGFIDILQIGRNDTEGYFYYVMELADDASGALEIQPETYVPKTLAKALLQRGRLPVGDCLELGMTLNLALTRLHEAGLIHRDIKPSNIIFVGGVPKLADIGLVIEVAEARSYVGTEGFIPPEGPNSPQADLYSLGKVLYEASMGKDRKDFPEPLTQMAEVPDATELLEFNAILLKACAASVKERYQSAGEMNADLALLQSGGSVRRQRTLTRRLRFVQRAGALVTALALVIGAGWLWQARETRLVRNLANEKTSLAQANARLAEENRERLVRLDIANGVRLLDADDSPAALLWFADALPRVAGRPAEEEIHRIRIQQILNVTPRPLTVIAESNSIDASAFSPDGRFIATSSWRGTLAVSDASSGKVLWRSTSDDKHLAEVHFSRDGERVCVGSTFQQGCAGLSLARVVFQLVEVRDARTGKLVFPGLRSNLVSSAFSPDDRWLAIALTNNLIQVLDQRTGALVLEMRGHSNEITALGFSPDGNVLVSASRDHTARIWRVPSGEPVGKPFEHERWVQRAVLSADARYLATAMAPQDKASPVVQVWDVETGEKIGPAIMETNDTRALFFGPRGHALLVTGDEVLNDVHIWDLANGLKHLRVLPVGMARCWEFSPDGRMLAIGTDSGFVSILSTDTWDLLFPAFRHTGWVESVHFSPSGTRLLTTSDDGTAKIWSLSLKAETARLSLTTNLVEAAAEGFRPPARTAGPIPVALQDGYLHLIDPDDMHEIQILRPEPGDHIIGGTAGATGRCWATVEAANVQSPRKLTFWTREADEFRPLPLLNCQQLFSLQFNADDSRLFVLADDQNESSAVYIWRTPRGTLEGTVPLPRNLKPLPGDVVPESVDPTGRFLLTTVPGKNGPVYELQLFDLSTGGLFGKSFPLTSIGGPPTRALFSPVGIRLAAVASQWAYIIDLQEGRLCLPWVKHGGDLFVLEWSPDGRKFITAGASGFIKLWDTASGAMLLSPMETHGVGLSAHWSADGRFIASRSDACRARVFDASTTEPLTPVLLHSGYIHWVCLTPGNRFITASEPNLLRAWDLKPTSLPADLIADYAKLLSGRRLTAGGVLMDIPAQELAELANSLRARAPALFE